MRENEVFNQGRKRVWMWDFQNKKRRKEEDRVLSERWRWVGLHLCLPCTVGSTDGFLMSAKKSDLENFSLLNPNFLLIISLR